MKTILFSVLFFASVVPIFSQNNGKITGKVFDEKDNTPIVDAAIQLTKVKDSVIAAGTSTGADGSFMLTGIPDGTYDLHVKYIGYRVLNVENIVIDKNTKERAFDSLKLKTGDQTTQEIDVEGNKPIMTFEGEKKVFNVSQSLTKGGTALDVLKQVPLVDVDINDNVSLRGSQNVKILVDDKPSPYASLKQIPADAIEKVEIITNPPAKYEAEGVTGIINIVMKKSVKLGFTGTFNSGLSYVKNLNGWGGFDLSFNKKKWTFFSSIYGGLFNWGFNYNRLTQYDNPISSLSNNDIGEGHSNYIWGHLGAEYELTKGKTLGLESSYSRGRWGNNDNSTNNNMNSFGSLASFYTENSSRGGLWNSFYANLYLNMKLNDKGRELNTSINFSGSPSANDFSQLTRYYDSNSVPVNISPRNQHDSTLYSYYNVNSQIDYTHPFSDAGKIEAGYKGTYRVSDNDFLSDTLNYNTNNFITDASVTNRLKLNEFINAFYGIFSNSIGKNFTYKLGLRLEQTNSKVELFTNNSSFKKSYLDFFPSVNLSEKFGSNNQVQLSYSRRITRPSYWRLNPFLNKNDARIWTEGNPNLNPEYTDSYELSLMFSQKAFTVTPLVFFRRSRDIISSYSYLIDSTVTLNTYRNASGSKAYGTDIVISSNALKWMSINGTFSFYYTKFDQEALTDYSAEEGFSWKANIRSTINIGDLFKIEVTYKYTGRKINSQGISWPSSNLDVALSRNFLKDKLTLTFSASDIFNTTKWENETDASSYRSTINYRWDSRLLYLNISYNFGNTDEKYQKKDDTKQNNNENKDSQDSGNGK